MDQLVQCNKCGCIKSQDEFPHRPGATRPSGVCNECTRDSNAARNREYRKRNGKAINARLQARRAQAHKEST